MPTVADMIAWAERKYATSETDANLIIDLNGIQDEIYTELNSYREGFGYFEVYSTLTVSGTLNYTLPSDCEPENIMTVQVSQETTIDDDTEWDYYIYTGITENTSEGYYWGKGTQDGKIAIVKDGETIDTDGLTIRIFYLPTPTQITATTQTPDLQRQYHNLYKYALVQSIASQGDNPDTELADFYQRRYEEFMSKVKKDIAYKYNTLSTKTEQLESRW